MINRFRTFMVSAGILSAGLIIYLFSRDDSILLNQWVYHLILDPGFKAIRTGIQHQQIPYWFKYSLPDGLWMASLMILILLIWDFKIHFRALPWITLAFASGVLTELAQGMGWIRGTFDVMDLVLMLIGGLFPISFILIKDRLCKTT